MFSIPQIAKVINQRPKRILEKVRSLEIPTQYKGNIPYIIKEDLSRLIVAYLNSKRTSIRTRQLAHNVFIQLDKKDLNLEVMTPKDNGKPLIASHCKASPKDKTTFVGDTDTSIPKGNPLYKVSVRLNTLSSFVKTMLAVCVHSLESLYFKFFALFVAIFVQMHHTAVWFYRSAPGDTASWPAAIGFAIMLDLFILVVTMEGRISIAKSFAIMTFISNMLYFQFWITFENGALWYTKAISSTIISAIIAFVLYSYTEIFIKYKNIQHPS